MKRQILMVISALIVSFSSGAYPKKPRLTVIMVVDQCAYHYLNKLSCHLKHGIKFLMRHGIVYQNAYYPHGMPSTGPGHTGLATGTTPNYHGIIGNHHCDPRGEKLMCDDDHQANAAVINPRGGYYNYGKGPAQIMVDGISDQFVLSSEPGAARVAYSVSLKSRSAICTANKLGKAIWFDPQSGMFTSSKAYYDRLPNWLVNFNQRHAPSRLSRFSWPLYFVECAPAYDFKFIDNYEYSTHPSIAGKSFTIDRASENPYRTFERTPAANKLILDLAYECIKTHITRKSCQELLLWVCLSPLDMVGHEYGPYSREAIDMIYHLDCQIEQFMDCVGEYLKRTDVLYVLTADHGVTPIPELLQEEGYPAQRLEYGSLIKELNDEARQMFNIDNLVCSCFSSQLYFNEMVFRKLSLADQNQILDHLKGVVEEYPGVKRVWIDKELDKTWYEPNQIEAFFKNQLYLGRSGRLIIQPFPYCIPDEFSTGTGHRTPYEPDTHVPLILYQKHNVERRIIYDKVWTLQLANSLAHLLQIQKPSASTYTMLPGLIDYDPITGEVILPVVL